jgi:hypothetical protein
LVSRSVMTAGFVPLRDPGKYRSWPVRLDEAGVLWGRSSQARTAMRWRPLGATPEKLRPATS